MPLLSNKLEHLLNPVGTAFHHCADHDDDLDSSRHFISYICGGDGRTCGPEPLEVIIPHCSPFECVHSPRTDTSELDSIDEDVNAIGHAISPTGTSRYCLVGQCPNKVKRNGVCWRHGGFRNCTSTGCINRAKSRGLCWTHGGGKRCDTPYCSKTALRYGHCWAHGGGKRCDADGCKRPAYERNGNRCTLHTRPAALSLES
ncbi:hypothetical protein H257_13809 [Aphanomyces astaci]|uniref:WRKY19-like zinc finger domain-containing protein n=1 Tax=Aphanomyces astaci TaxID=112090 RepID=W4FUT4_APHAT|nr:hypothetical protein H257_13809 [Aphanomyces astaci]ETV70711.1 hypothetical protein H257_13809 [Aphanomyces astaci]|eukprot:XP_009839775.1 hypothetical protein H257_13809 [Aphanomyces astaci]